MFCRKNNVMQVIRLSKWPHFPPSSLSISSNIDPSTLNSTLLSTLDVDLCPVVSKQSCHVSSSLCFLTPSIVTGQNYMWEKNNLPEVLHPELWFFFPDNWRHWASITHSTLSTSSICANCFMTFHSTSILLHHLHLPLSISWPTLKTKWPSAAHSHSGLTQPTTYSLIKNFTADLIWNGVRWEHTQTLHQALHNMPLNPLSS